MNKGKVYLIGAGPGSIDYLTVKAYRLIQKGEIILYDTLTGREIRDLAINAEEIHHVGKKSQGRDRTIRSQETVNRLMVRKAKSGKMVIRLKGGDPNVFGRGGEEAICLAEADIPFEIIPGISSILAAPGLANIPLTHRKLASSFTVITGHEDPTKKSSALNWKALAQNIIAGGTLVILMGVRKSGKNTQQLRKNGVPAKTPVAVIEKATYAEEKIVTGNLENIVSLTLEHNINPPALFVIGEVVTIREQIENMTKRLTEPQPTEFSDDLAPLYSHRPISMVG